MSRSDNWVRYLLQNVKYICNESWMSFFMNERSISFYHSARQVFLLFCLNLRMKNYDIEKIFCM